jgi:hypothetical protein
MSHRISIGSLIHASTDQRFAADLPRPGIDQRNHVLHRPKPIRNASGHCRGDAQRLEAPLSAIMDEPYKTESFVFHLNQLCKPERGKVLRKVEERRIFRFQFVDPLMQPFIVMKSLEAGIINMSIMEKFRIDRQRELSI